MWQSRQVPTPSLLNAGLVPGPLPPRSQLLQMMTFEPVSTKVRSLKLTRVQKSSVVIIARARRERPGDEAN